MTQEPELTNLQQLLDKIANAARDKEHISLGVIVEAVGSRSFGPILAVVGVGIASPLSGIPGMPTITSILVFLVAVQLLLHKKHIWMPRWLLKRSVTKTKLLKAIKWLETPAKFIDRWLKPRGTILVRRHIIAIVCVLISLGMPALELVPFSSSGAGVVLAAFGLSLIADDGLLATFAFGFTVFIASVSIYYLL